LYKLFLESGREWAEPDWRRIQLEFNARARSRQAAGLIPLASWSNAGCSRKFVHGRYSTGRGAMQHDGIRLQQAGKKNEPSVTQRAEMMTARMLVLQHALLIFQKPRLFPLLFGDLC
jgi:hypothetical protein